MNQPFIQRLQARFLQTGYRQVKVLDPVISYIKQAQDQIYLINLLDISWLPRHEWSSFNLEVQRQSEYVLQSVPTQRKFILNIFIGNEQVMDLYTDYQDLGLDFSSPFLHLYWFVNISHGKIAVPGQMPDRLLGIEIYIRQSFMNSGTTHFQNHGLRKKTSKIQVTSALIAVNVILWFVFTIFLDNQMVLKSMGLNSVRLFKQFEVWRLFTHMFTHLSITHLAYNMLSLYIFGSRLEKYLGNGRFFMMYIITGLFAGLSSVIFNFFAQPSVYQMHIYGIGASGAIFGIIGSALAMTHTTKDHLEGLSAYIIGAMALVGIVMGFTETNVDNIAHIGGFISGFIFTKMLMKQNYLA